MEGNRKQEYLAVQHIASCGTLKPLSPTVSWVRATLTSTYFPQKYIYWRQNRESYSYLIRNFEEMSVKKEDKAIPVSLWDDAKLRPWTIDRGLDAEIDAENEKLQDMIQATSGSKIAGV